MTNAQGSAPQAPLYYIIAGEASGDVIGAGVIRELRDLSDGQARFTGIGGERMAAEGLTSLFPISELAVMGVAEIVPRAPALLDRVTETVADVTRTRPDALITIDCQSFSRRVARRLRKQRDRGKLSLRLIHIVAPTVWAWRPWRVRKCARAFDHLLTLFPFEARYFERPYFKRHRLPTSFIGHPAADQPQGDGSAFRRRHGMAPDARILTFMPGSRLMEVNALGQAFAETAAIVARRWPGLKIVIPTVDIVAARVREMVADWPDPPLIVTGEAEKFDAFAASDAALAVSGTATLELVLAETPLVAAYRAHWLSVAIGRWLVDLSVVLLPNRILDRPLVEFFLQDECRPEAMAAALTQLVEGADTRATFKAAAVELRAALRAVPGENAFRTAAHRIVALTPPNAARDQQPG